MRLVFVCDCGNEVGFFATGERDEARRQRVEAEDDDRLQVQAVPDGLVLHCRFCQERFVVEG